MLSVAGRYTSVLLDFQINLRILIPYNPNKLGEMGCCVGSSHKFSLFIFFLILFSFSSYVANFIQTLQVKNTHMVLYSLKSIFFLGPGFYLKVKSQYFILLFIAVSNMIPLLRQCCQMFFSCLVGVGMGWEWEKNRVTEIVEKSHWLINKIFSHHTYLWSHLNIFLGLITEK